MEGNIWTCITEQVEHAPLRENSRHEVPQDQARCTASKGRVEGGACACPNAFQTPSCMATGQSLQELRG